MQTNLSQIMRKVQRIDIRTRRMANDALAGRFRSVFRGRGMDFDEVREYSPGDEVRTMDWNVTARAGHPFVKKYREEHELTVLLAVDVSASGDFGSSERTKRDIEAEVACLLALSAVRHNDKVGLVLFSDQIEGYVTPRRGRNHVLRLVREVLSCRPRRRGTDIGHALDFINKVTKRRAIVIVVSDFQSADAPAAALSRLRPSLQAVRRRHDVVAVWIRDPRECSLPDVGLLAIEDAETGEVVELDTGSARVRQSFAQKAQAQHDGLRRFFRTESIDVAEIDTAVPYLPVLIGFFRARQGRQR